MATLRTASPTKVPGHTALRSSSFVTSSPERAIRYWSTAKGLGLIFISSVPSHRHSLVKSRQKGSKTMMCFSFATGITEILRQVYDFHWTLRYCRLLMEGLQHKAAFVIQFRQETAIETGRFEGRVEHIASTKAKRFHSLDELLTFMAQMLTEVRKPDHSNPQSQ